MTQKTKKIMIISFAALLAIGIIIGIVIGSLLACYNQDDTALGGDANMEIKFDKSASKLGRNIFLASKNKENDIWQQNSLPIGNGMIGGSVYGEVFNERVIFNEKTLWTGGPSKDRPDYNGGNITEKDENGKTVSDYYKEIQKLFEEGKDAEASELCNKLVGLQDGYGNYQCWGEIDIKNNHSFKKVSEYERHLSLENAIAGVSYIGNNTKFTREYFVSHPDKVLVIKLNAEGEESLNMDISFPSAQNGVSEASVTEKGGSIITYGEVADNQLQYYSKLEVVTSGKVTSSASSLNVKDTKCAVIVVSAATDYAPIYPTYRRENKDEHRSNVDSWIKAATNKGYEDIKKAHIEDYKELYDRVSIDLGASKQTATTDKLLKKYRSGFIKQSQKRYMEQLLYNYGRYLTIASSRKTDILPSNLQGLWNNQNNPQWGADFHMNVNLQMNYWPTYNTNLAECATPLINYVDDLREPGRVTADTYFGVTSGSGEANGYVFHTQNTPFGWTCPGWEFDWGWSPAATAWILQNVYEYYEYTGDKQMLEKQIYPMLEEASKFFSTILVQDTKTGRLVTSPTYSPEHGPKTMGNTYEQSLIWQLFNDTIEAANILQKQNEPLIVKISEQIKKLQPIEIGESGQIKEWYHETKLGKIGETHHRHLSHLLGLFPGDLINKDTHPEWREAAKVSLNKRGDKSTGWAMGQRINTWARIGDGDRAYKLINQLFKSGLYSNMWDAHPPFQIDGNFGYTAGVTEMLMQSNLGYIELLPALPSKWTKGKISGIIARGNFEISMAWENGQITSLNIISHNGGDCVIKCGKTDLKIVDKNGEAVLSMAKDGKVIFETTAGMEYKLI